MTDKNKTDIHLQPVDLLRQAVRVRTDNNLLPVTHANFNQHQIQESIQILKNTQITI